MSISGRSQRSTPVSPALRPSRAPSRGPTPSVRSSPHTQPTRKVTTVPPWARNEPPSPDGTPYLSPIINSTLRPTDTIPPLSLSPVPSDPERIAPTLSSASTSLHPPDQTETSWWTFVTHPLPRNRIHGADHGKDKEREKADPTSPRSPAAPLEPHLHLSPTSTAHDPLPQGGNPASRTSPTDPTSARKAPRGLGSFFPRAGIQQHLTMPSAPLVQPSSTPASPSSVLRSLQYPVSHHPGLAPRPPSPAFSSSPKNGRPASMHLDLSRPEGVLPEGTLRQVLTPGWESPWRPTLPLHATHEEGHPNAPRQGQGQGQVEQDDYPWDLSGHPSAHSPHPPRPLSASPNGMTRVGSLTRGRSRGRGAVEFVGEKGESRWKKGRRRWRNFCLYHSSTPLLFRLLNLIFTTAALAVAIHTQLEEQDADVERVIGSSTAMMVVFAPLTLIHVVIAIYLEYFGRPLGLWRTSAKLAYTLVEVIFVCLWSSALSLSVDNYLTTPLRCAPRHMTSWWSDQSPAPNPLPADDGDIGTTVCRSQLALICLVLVGLCSYCSNLVISLFRIFERVKVRTVDYRWGSWGNAAV